MIPLRRRQMRRLGLVVVSGVLLFASAPADVRAGLDEYVKKPDPVYTWQQISNHTTPAGSIHNLKLTSQVWQGITWHHDLRIYEPREVAYGDTVLLLITGGSSDSRPKEDDHKQAFTLARLCGARVAVLPQVPNQPLLDGKTEDELIAETFVRYLQTQDENWPLLFPMVKSAVRAMDAVQAWAKDKGKPPVTRFVVTGASKRGWTTWLTGAADDRVVAIAPIVIVMLNMGKQGPNQLKVWGQYSEQIHDYVDRGLTEKVQTPAGTKLWKMVDPLSYRDRLTKPKFLINGTNDRYWTLDALDLYWDGLKGPKYLVELPNAGHGLEANRDWALNGVGAFFRHVVTNRPLPQISWSFTDGGKTDSALTIHAAPPPQSARLWTARSQTRDFRESRWESSALEAGERITGRIAPPTSGPLAAFGELEYQIDGIPYHLTTSFVEPGLDKTGDPLPPISDRARQVHAAGMLFDGHNDLPWRLRTEGDFALTKFDLSRRLDAGQTDIPRLREGGVKAQFWSVYIPSEHPNPARTVTEQIDLVRRLAERYPDALEMAYTAGDIERIVHSGKIASLIGIEGGVAIENSLAQLRAFYTMGARYMTLTHNTTLEWADAATDAPKHDGLSPLGERIVKEMNRLGMLVDISHVSAATMADALRVSSAPVIASHSSAYAICPSPRNVPDDILKAVKQNGGVVMVNFYSGFIVPESGKKMRAILQEIRAKYSDRAQRTKALEEWYKTEGAKQSRGTYRDVVDHIDHVVKVAGIDHVGIGSDFDGITMWPVGLDDVASYPRLTDELLNRGYSESDVHKILGANALRAFREAENVARRLRASTPPDVDEIKAERRER